ncbi:MAG: hypothetical protein MUF59_10825, partial [Candidatus Krumholzibacteria bacterium]|nr:hypothetical protein [Candidatus Krumholzibacteria bacterium]
LLALIFVVVISAEVSAGRYAYIGLFVDGAHSLDRQDIPAPYVFYTTWVWILPGYDGVQCANFKMIQPEWNLCIKTTPNPLTTVVLGEPYDDEGVSFCFGACQTDWVWLYQLQQLPTAAGVPGYIEIVEWPRSGAVEIADCTCGYPIEPATVLNKLGLNQNALIHTDEASWGAIKSICSGR